MLTRSRIAFEAFTEESPLAVNGEWVASLWRAQFRQWAMMGSSKEEAVKLLADYILEKQRLWTATSPA